ncbi:DEAD/DEAH box helicase [Variovorax guangxiensis]|uniref:DEAD/DEAH box helicase n=1 Tax=Variovorax guangxiensis TaxID=1775474 RepID=A0A502DKF5_9BURK|nr:DEAD/DEAH box helicase [Variovorax guangxiensis]TPG20625.1 DEAD/DEAH box helicase [Variovorax ginsengisoli]TPG25788.1 DEAD/DEAH box helicase [Variovorax guangxiensis]
MTDAYIQAQGDLAPVQSDDIAVVDTFFAAEADLAPVHIIEDGVESAELAADAAEPQEPKLPNGFVRLGLAAELVAAVADLGFDQPTAVQDKVIPLALTSSEEGDARFIDLMVSSQTGSGKTAAFLLPVLHTLLKQEAEAEAASKAEFARLAAEAVARGEAPPKKAKRKDPTNTRNFKAATPGALILCPTRELAQQVAHDAIDLVKHCRGLRVASVVGGMPYQLQIAKLQNANLVVATPGRLLDLQRSMQIKLDQVQFLVVDEADRMLDLGFSDDLAEVNQLTVARKQTMMFSATFAPRIQQLATRVMRQPQKIQIDSPQEKHANIKQVLFWADNTQHKRKMLDHWLRDTTINQAIVFASTQVECDGLANDLQQDGFSAVALHGALSQGLRNRRLMALRQGQVQILVATDVAARGIDVPTITHVFNFGLPMKAEDYTHRIGRTGRAGRDGIAVTFAEFRDRRKIMDIEHYSHQQFKAETIPGLEPQQRMPQSRPQGNFGGAGRGDSHSRGGERKFGGGGGAGPRGGNGGGYGGASGFNDRGPRGAAAPGARPHHGHNAGFGGGRDEGGGGFGRKPGWGDSAPRGAGPSRGEGFAPRNEGFAPRGENFAPRGAAGGGKVFVPRDAAKRAFKPSR